VIKRYLYLFLLTLAYCLPVLTAAFATGNKNVPWALLPLALNFAVFWGCWKLDYENGEENREKIRRKRTLSTYITLMFGFVIALIVIATNSPVVVCSTILMVLISWLVYIVV
jgi:ABC-type multidrug transport system permease subunit